MARSTFCLCASHRNRDVETEVRGRGEEAGRLVGVFSYQSVDSVLCLARPARPGDVTNVLDYQVLDGAIKWRDGSFFRQKR